MKENSKKKGKGKGTMFILDRYRQKALSKNLKVWLLHQVMKEGILRSQKALQYNNR